MSRRHSGTIGNRPVALLFSLLTLGVFMFGAPAFAQDDDDLDEDADLNDEDLDDEDLDDEDLDDGDLGDAGKKAQDTGAEGGGPATDDEDENDGDFDAVRAIEREPRPGTPLIENKLYDLGLTLEGSGMFDYSYGDKFVSHIGGHGALGFHIFEWLGVEVFAGGFYPRELPITKTVRQSGRSFLDAGEAPKLSDLWQSFAFAGATAEWAPLYGKLSFVSEVDVTFQFYFFGGGAVEGIALPDDSADPAGTINTNRDFYLGVVTGKQFNYNARVSAVYGVGVRLIPWRYLAVRIELRNMLGVNPVVDEVDYPELDLSYIPQLTIGFSFLI